MEHKEHIDVLLVCALKDEFEQIICINDNISSAGWQKKTLSDGRLVADAVFVGKDKPSFTIRTTWCSYMGREEASALVQKLFIDTNFNCIAMTGICAGRRGKVELGDVIFADRLWSYDAGKLISDEKGSVFQEDILQYRQSDVIIQRMHNISVDISAWPIPRPQFTLENQEDWVIQCIGSGIIPHKQDDFQYKCPDWEKVLERLLNKNLVTEELILTNDGRNYFRKLEIFNPDRHYKSKPFNLHIAPLATGAAVVEDETIFSKLSKSMRKVLGIDMEASALGAIGSINNIPVIVAKAVSDFGDLYKDDRYRHFASQASARVMVQFLQENSDLFASQKPQANVTSNENENELIYFLSEEYPEVSDVRALWKRAGGRNSDISNISRPRDLWLNVWIKSLNGSNVTPFKLLTEVAKDYPKNTIIKSHLNKLTNNPNE
ncbi:hypothetical protein ACRQTN_07240 [Pectobacterium brasiliense]|uniref:hypothetical protein n=1 Tax=Pectobacterium brasiliense TaxID=180957 RepID=UPI003EC02C7D